ncbi:MAG: ABC transporter permease [Firmicutes bacterium]|nr:ABC transporter permease [Bacillota bacterium]MDD7601449.1 ABC transporter permease [Bacillota bacterium]MDY5857019.1 ABC transporter permease [Anaerovoracaceae bacterium]
MNTLKEIVKDHIDYRKQLVQLAKADMKKAYGGVLGMGWAIIRPAILIFVFWFAFSVGLRKGGDVDGYPFFLWLIAGMIPWFYMRDMITGGAGSIRRYKYLVTKIKFPVSTIPTFVSMGNLVTHMGLVVIMIVIYMLFGYYPTVYYLQIPLYMAMMFLFFTAWGLFAGVLSSISRDFLNLVKSLTQALFWLSGILYDANAIDQQWIRNILLFNPVTIVVNGYRNALIHQQWFWEDPQQLMNFAIVYLVMLCLAVWSYSKLKKDIPDVL